MTQYKQVSFEVELPSGKVEKLTLSPVNYKQDFTRFVQQYGLTSTEAELCKQKIQRAIIQLAHRIQNAGKNTERTQTQFTKYHGSPDKSPSSQDSFPKREIDSVNRSDMLPPEENPSSRFELRSHHDIPRLFPQSSVPQLSQDPQPQSHSKYKPPSRAYTLESARKNEVFLLSHLPQPKNSYTRWFQSQSEKKIPDMHANVYKAITQSWTAKLSAERNLALEKEAKQFEEMMQYQSGKSKKVNPQFFDTLHKAGTHSSNKRRELIGEKQDSAASYLQQFKNGLRQNKFQNSREIKATKAVSPKFNEKSGRQCEARQIRESEEKKKEAQKKREAEIRREMKKRRPRSPRFREIEEKERKYDGIKMEFEKRENKCQMKFKESISNVSSYQILKNEDSTKVLQPNSLRKMDAEYSQSEGGFSREGKQAQLTAELYESPMTEQAKEAPSQTSEKAMDYHSPVEGVLLETIQEIAREDQQLLEEQLKKQSPLHNLPSAQVPVEIGDFDMFPEQENSGLFSNNHLDNDDADNDGDAVCI